MTILEKHNFDLDMDSWASKIITAECWKENNPTKTGFELCGNFHYEVFLDRLDLNPETIEVNITDEGGCEIELNEVDYKKLKGECFAVIKDRYRF